MSWRDVRVEGRQTRDGQWQQIERFLPGRPDSAGVTAKDNRLFVDGVLRVLRSGAECKDLPEKVRQVEKCPQALHRRGQG